MICRENHDGRIWIALVQMSKWQQQAWTRVSVIRLLDESGHRPAGKLPGHLRMPQVALAHDHEQSFCRNYHCSSTESMLKHVASTYKVYILLGKSVAAQLLNERSQPTSLPAASMIPQRVRNPDLEQGSKSISDTASNSKAS